MVFALETGAESTPLSLRRRRGRYRAQTKEERSNQNSLKDWKAVVWCGTRNSFFPSGVGLHFLCRYIMRICIFSNIILKMQCRLVRHLIMTHSVDTLSQIDKLTDYNVLQNDTDAQLISKGHTFPPSAHSRYTSIRT